MTFHQISAADWPGALVRLKGQPIEGHDRIGTVQRIPREGWATVAGQFTRCEPQEFPIAALERIEVRVLPDA